MITLIPTMASFSFRMFNFTRSPHTSLCLSRIQRIERNGNNPYISYANRRKIRFSIHFVGTAAGVEKTDVRFFFKHLLVHPHSLASVGDHENVGFRIAIQICNRIICQIFAMQLAAYSVNLNIHSTALLWRAECEMQTHAVDIEVRSLGAHKSCVLHIACYIM